MFLGQAPPTIWGWALAVAAPAVLLLVDAADKKARRRGYRNSQPSTG